jgi:hypothetical protein
MCLDIDSDDNRRSAVHHERRSKEIYRYEHIQQTTNLLLMLSDSWCIRGKTAP